MGDTTALLGYTPDPSLLTTDFISQLLIEQPISIRKQFRTSHLRRWNYMGDRVGKEVAADFYTKAPISSSLIGAFSFEDYRTLTRRQAMA